MRERFGHSIGTPDGNISGKSLQFLFESLIYGPATDNKMTDAAESSPLFRNLQGVINLHRDHRSEGNLFIYIFQRMTTWANRNKMEMALYTPHHHHLTCNIIERHAEQGTITRFQSQEITSDAGRVEHSLLLYHHRFGLSRGTTGMNKHPVATVIPF